MVAATRTIENPTIVTRVARSEIAAGRTLKPARA